MTSRPAAPESETPEVDALFEEFINAGGEKDVIDYHAIMRKLDLLARSLERRLSLAQAEIERERMRVVGCSVAALGNWREGDSLHADYDCAAIRDVAKLRVKYDEAQARIAELEEELLKARSALALAAEDDMGREELLRNAEKDAARYRWLRDESHKHSVAAPTGTMMAGNGIKVIYDFPTVKVPCTAMLGGESLDAAIDAALQDKIDK